jgi:hypothetical protein
MAVHRNVTGTLAAWLALVWSLSAAGCAGGSTVTVEPGQVTVTQSAPRVGQYERLELAIAIRDLQVANPFDPREIDLAGVFHTPSGTALTVPAFYAIPYERSHGEDGREVLTRIGDGEFRVRFAGREVGEYRYEVVSRGGEKPVVLGQGRFAVARSDRPGYVRISARSPLFFELDSGHPFFAIGENMCWPRQGGTYDYDTWMGKLAENGGNYVRLWLINDWNQLGLENRPQTESGDENGLGRYTQQPAWRVDYIVQLGERLGVRALMCIDSFNSLDASSRNGNWAHSAYNAENGGPCATPAGFFTNAEAKRLFKQRLRYLVARWGYSTSVLAWEFWNEVDLVTGYDSGAVAGWHREMADYLHSIDPWHHPITTSYSRTDGDPAVDKLSQMNFLQSHNYGSRDVAGMVYDWSRRFLETYGKPYYLGEYGANVRGDLADNEGVQLHNGLWAGMLTGGPGTAMLWYWDWVERNDLYHEFAPVAAFAAEVDWAGEDYQPAQIAGVRYAGGAKPERNGTLELDPSGESWEGPSPFLEPQTLVVGTDGVVSNREKLGRMLHGTGHAEWRNPVTFEVNYPAAGRFEVTVGQVSRSGGAQLVILLDRKEALVQDLAPGGRRAPSVTYGIDVPAGKHEIRVENHGQDWFRVSYQFVGYLTAPNLRVLALRGARSALVWAQNREHTWWRASRDEVTPAQAAEVTLTGLTPGRYAVEQWDTATGKVVKRATATSRDGTITLTTPDAMIGDVAYKVMPQGGG